MYYKKPDRGFTLIELLVVLSIIALAASAILAGFSTARLKARNSQRIQEVLAYTKAAELYNVNNRKYPGTNTAYRCLGRGSSGSCFSGVAGDSTLDSTFATEMRGAVTPAGIDAGLDVYTGYLYACVNSGCTGYYLRYVLESTGVECASGSSVIAGSSAVNAGRTYCQVVTCPLGTSPTQSPNNTVPFTCN